jgi:hypothetical protein
VEPPERVLNPWINHEIFFRRAAWSTCKLAGREAGFVVRRLIKVATTYFNRELLIEEPYGKMAAAGLTPNVHKIGVKANTAPRFGE